MRTLWMAGALLAMLSPAHAATVTTLLSHDLARGPGREGSMLTVELAPNEAGAVHRHNAQVFVYVVSGAVVMQVRGGPEVTLHAGETFYEAPTDIHTVSRNPSGTEPAKFVAFFVKRKGAPILVPAR